jgi:hypothetical protein
LGSWIFIPTVLFHFKTGLLMKKIFTLVFLLSIILSAHSEIISKTYNVSDLKVSNSRGYQVVSFDEMLVAGRAGEPGLPYYAVKLMLPAGHEAVSITFKGTDKINLQGYFKIAPVQHSRPLSDDSPSSFTINDAIYNSNDTYPASTTGKLSTYFMNGYAFALSTFTPVEYNPLDGKLSYYQTVTVTIETRSTERAVDALKNLTSNKKSLQQCRSYAQNPEQAEYYPNPGRSLDSYDVLIITPQTFSTQIHDLVGLYMNQGLKAKIITTEYIEGHLTGIDSPEKIRNLIIGEYQNYGISQVILGGDAELVAYRGFFCHVQSSSVYEDTNIPSDLYYSALDGNWNTNNDNLWGEIGEDDLLPEISVGRMSFSNATELASMINKTSLYQNHPVEGELNNHLLAGENLYYNPDTWGSDYLELLVGTHSENGYTTTGFPASYPIVRMYDEETEWSPVDLMNMINSGRSFINHAGHANEYYTMKLYNWDIVDANFTGVNGTTHNFPIVYSHGCICGAFDANDCIAELMVSIHNFASAFVGNSRYGWFNEGQTEGPSAHLQREFIDALYTDSLNRIGSAHMESKIATAPWVNAPGQWEEGALRWCFYDCNVLGDPAMAVWTNEPLNIVTSYPSELPTGSSSFEVVVTNGGLPAAGLTVASIKNNVLIGSGITNQNGIAEVMLDSTINVAGPASIVVSGYNCKPTSYNVQFSTDIKADNIKVANLKVYPNPATDYVTIVMDKNNAGTNLQLKDPSGRIVKEFSVDGTSKTLTVPVKGIEPGIYFLTLPGYQTNEVVKVIIK